MPVPEDELPPDSDGGDADEDIEFEIAFYERILEQVPESVDVLMALGNDYTRRGLVAEGLAVDERLCQIRAGDPIVRYNLACSYSLLGKVDQAIETLAKAIKLGYRDFGHMQRDRDLEGIRQDPRYLALLEDVLRQRLTS